MHRKPLLRLSLVALLSGGMSGTSGFCQEARPQPGTASPETPANAQTPLFAGITVHRRTIRTESPEAQRYFDQGLNWSYAFNHDEAIRSFEQAARYDPNCAMAWWGIALCHGPHINNPVMDERSSAAAWQAISKAVSLSDRGSPVEHALIEALATRYVAQPEQNIREREMLNRRYAEAMRAVHEKYPDDTDAAVLFAESMMDLRPWDLWSDEGEARPETPGVLAVLETTLARQPDHPGANHLYIHAIEASPRPGKGAAAADRLRTLMPGSGHMVHMPAHIDVKTGKWSLAAEQNERAIKVDVNYRRASPRQAFYHVYMVHNPHFLAFVCMMEGRQKRAIQAAREMIDSIPAEFLDQSPALADPFMAIEYQVVVRFGRWQDVLALPPPRKDLPIATAMWRFSRATALAAQGSLVAAEKEQALFRDAVAAVPEGASGAINPAHAILRVGEHTLAGELAFQKGELDRAVAELNKGVAAETALLYMEPPEWIQPVRHSLGAVLMSAKRWDEAAKVYRADLAEWPENGWSLYGLSQCLRALDDASADAVEQRFRAAWSRSDTEIQATCFCVPRPAREPNE